MLFRLIENEAGYSFRNLDVGAVVAADEQSAVHHVLYLTGAAGFRTWF